MLWVKATIIRVDTCRCLVPQIHGVQVHNIASTQELGKPSAEEDLSISQNTQKKVQEYRPFCTISDFFQNSVVVFSSELHTCPVSWSVMCTLYLYVNGFCSAAYCFSINPRILLYHFLMQAQGVVISWHQGRQAYDKIKYSFALKKYCGEMLKCFPPSKRLSKSAPLIHVMKVCQFLMAIFRRVKYPTITSLITQVKITAKGFSNLEKSKAIISNLTMVPTVGLMENCKIKSAAPFGVFVKISPGRVWSYQSFSSVLQGLCHISELSANWLAKAEDRNHYIVNLDWTQQKVMHMQRTTLPKTGGATMANVKPLKRMRPKRQKPRVFDESNIGNSRFCWQVFPEPVRNSFQMIDISVDDEGKQLTVFLGGDQRQVIHYGKGFTLFIDLLNGPVFCGPRVAVKFRDF
ncbi:hypothetical protein BUALT_Bualt02G0008600 [Buddleja alternifolia]|uniref:Transposase n=1 Tax=Buddleja alternifolia TaxID=168488 RepID=A0AAV6Y365_9LAMI|nr:hypothetical protein BUALT_Bualt02G0008600 [Buddleja alternifolia]